MGQPSKTRGFRSSDNISRNVWNFGFEGTCTEQAVNRKKDGCEELWLNRPR